MVVPLQGFARYGKNKTKNKRGWIRIVEAMIAILLITGFLLLVIQRNEERVDISQRVYDLENSILREIQLNKTFRDYILDSTPPVEYEELDLGLKNHLDSRPPEYLNCSAKICSFDVLCDDDIQQENVYVRSVMISANSEKYSPRQLKLFCWVV